MMSSSYTIRTMSATELTEELQGLIIARWCRTLRFTNDFFKLTDPDSYWNVYPTFVRRLLERQDCQVRLAVLAEDTDVVLGFCVYRGAALDYVHTQRDARRLGIARALIEEQGFEKITHVTKSGLQLWAKVLPKVKFDPWFI
jgi:ribosomal protein S18 acetylase RimI-like enzyme